jgi:UDP-N-acetylmuramyl tripeptide synthase
MQLDINLSWPSFMAYDGTQLPSDPRPFKVGDFPRAAERYYSPSARDFVAVYARAASSATDAAANAAPAHGTNGTNAADTTTTGAKADATTPRTQVACTTTTENPRNPRQPATTPRVAC